MKQWFYTNFRRKRPQCKFFVHPTGLGTNCSTCEDIKRILEHCSGPVVIFHIDATGSLVKDPSCHGKKGHNESRILNYNIVLRANNITYPIVEMVSSMGNSETIAYMMRQLRTLLITDVPNFKPKKIILISDWAPQN